MSNEPGDGKRSPMDIAKEKRKEYSSKILSSLSSSAKQVQKSLQSVIPDPIKKEKEKYRLLTEEHLSGVSSSEYMEFILNINLYDTIPNGHK